MSSKKVVEFLSTHVTKYLADSKSKIRVEHDVFVCRKDGVCLFAELSKNLEIQKLGALVAGMWQAAQSVSSLSGVATSDQVLQFSTSANGVIVYPLLLSGETLLLTTLFSGEINPGRLKNSCRLLRDNLEYEFSDYQIIQPINSVQAEGHKFLFTNISDSEIDHLFSFVGN